MNIDTQISQREFPNPTVVTLVHGTWGRGFWKIKDTGKRWFDEGSDFRHRLVESFTTEGIPTPIIEVFKWTGYNRFKDRHIAAMELADLLDDQRGRLPACDQLIIAHSHGGNVALRAIEHMKEQIATPRIVCMATPFLEVYRPRVNALPLERYGFWVTSFLALLALQLLWTPLPWYIAVLGFLGFALIVITREVLHQAARRRGIEDFSSELSRLSSHDFFEASGTELLVLRGIDDEAGTSLAFASVCRFTSKIVSIVCERLYGNMIRSAIFAFFATILVYLVSLFWLGKPTGFTDINITPVVLVWAVPLFILWLTYVVKHLSQLVYGTGLRFLDAEISVNSAPDCRNKVAIRTLFRGDVFNGKALRHSIYDEPACAGDIAKWLRACVLNAPIAWGARNVLR